MHAPRGRWAPTPSGFLHVGNARSALLAWLSIRSAGGRFLYRLEDLDPPRVLGGAAEQAEDDLRWLGLDWDEGGGLDGPRGPYEQSRRSDRYESALGRLAADGRLFPCHRTRRELRDIASAPHGPGGPAYPPRLRPAELEPDWYDAFVGTEPGEGAAALRFRVDPGVVTFRDGLFGECRQDVAAEVGDFVLKRRDGLYAYQLAVIVDDLAMGVDEVVRGVDLLDSTARQIQLIRALGGREP
ncbi:MAG: glutamate--tRNA ligase family protein, partial [Acidobacteriota bacterium]